MKKLFALLLASILVISLFAGCTATNEAPKKETSEKTDGMSMDTEKPTITFVHGFYHDESEWPAAAQMRQIYQDFADSLSLLDEVILVDIYPAREAPIPGVTSKLIYDNLRPGIEKSMCKKEEILNILKDKNIEVLITLGAGDIDNYVPEIKELLEKR